MRLSVVVPVTVAIAHVSPECGGAIGVVRLEHRGCFGDWWLQRGECMERGVALDCCVTTDCCIVGNG